MQTFLGLVIQVDRSQQELQHCPLLLLPDTAAASLLQTFNLSALLKIHKGAN